MNDDFATLIDKYLNGKASEDERERVETWYQSFESHPGLTDLFSPGEIAEAMAANFAALTRKLDLTQR